MNSVTEKVSGNGHVRLEDASTTEKKSLNSKLLSEQGSGGVSFFSGLIDNDEFNNDLSGPKGVDTYDKMRRTDAQVQALLYAVQLPVLAADWVIQRPTDNENEASKITDEHIAFVQDNLFQRIDFQAFLRHAMSCLWAGFSWFEKVYVIEDGKWYIAKLSPRLASTLYKWWTDDHDNLIRVTQRTKTTGNRTRRTASGTDPNEVDLEKDKIVLFSFQQEGNNFEGMSLLRGAYKHWFIKDNIYRIDAIRHERFAIGVPHIELPEEWDSDDLAAAQKIGRNWKGGSQSYVVTPQGWGIEIIQMTGSALDVMSTIQHHNEEIAKAGLAQFINFGTTQTGTRALGEVTTNFFYDALLALTNWMSEVVNREIIWPLMDINFPNNPRPQLQATDIGAISMSELLAALRIMGDTFITPDLELENRLRGLLNLPLKNEDAFQDDQERRGVSGKTNEEEKDDEIEKEDRQEERDERKADNASERKKAEPAPVAAKPASGRVAASDTYRDKTYLEEHVALSEIEFVLDSSRDRIMHRVMVVRDEWTDVLRTGVERALSTGRLSEIMMTDLGAMDEKRMENHIQPLLFDLYKQGQVAVRREVTSQAVSANTGVALPLSLRDDVVSGTEAVTIMRNRTQDIVSRLSRKTVETAHRVALDVQRTKGSDFTEDDLDNIVREMTNSVEKEARLMATKNTSEAYSLGRVAEATNLAGAGVIETFGTFSSILDDNNCQPCKRLDGDKVEINTPRFHEISPPLLSCEGRGACRCMWLYTLKV